MAGASPPRINFIMETHAMHFENNKKSLPRRRAIALAAALAIGLSGSPGASAFDVDAGDYTALPAGTTLAAVYYQNVSRDALLAGGNKVAGNNRLDSNVGILRGVHYLNVGGYIIDPQFLLPFGSLEGKRSLSGLGEESGVGDLILATTLWLVNKPASGTYFGLTPFLQLPTGDYERNRALNLGENRWRLTLQGGFITPLADRLLLDVIGDVTFYGKNDDYGPSGVKMTQKAQYQLQTHLRYNLTPAWDIRFGLSHINGGETAVADVDQNNRQRTTKLSIGSGYFITPTLQFLANYGRDVAVENGFREENRFNLRLLTLF
jgi:hypothetical protein